jgi:hypothetical protein
LEGPERGVDHNLVAWAGKDYEFSGDGAAGYDRIAVKLTHAGHGSSAVVLVSWPGEEFGHVFTALNHRGRVVWYDPQSGEVSPRPIHTGVSHVWGTVLGPDRAPR